MMKKKIQKIYDAVFEIPLISLPQINIGGNIENNIVIENGYLSTYYQNTTKNIQNIIIKRKVIIDKLNELVDSKITIIADTNPFLKIFKPFIDKAANNYICKINKFLQMIEEENGLIDIETLLGKSIDNLIVSPVQEYPDMFKGVTIGNGKIRIGLPGINKDIVLDANDIETFKQSLVK